MWFLFLTFAVAAAAEPPSVQKAMELVTAGKLEQAASMFLDLEQAGPENPEIAYRFGLVLLKQGKLADARRRLETAAKLDPKSPFVWSALGLLHDSLGKAAALDDAPSAAREFQEAIRLDPGRAPYYLDLAQLLLDHDTAEPAQAVLENAARRFPGNPAVLHLLGVAAYAQGKTQEALVECGKQINDYPELCGRV